jgi:dTDP-glucose 4,6-dehydratase
MKLIEAEDLNHVLNKTKDLWEIVRNKSIFLTGGTGFFGKWLLQSFAYINETLNLNSTITVLTRDPDKFLSQFPYHQNQPSINFIKGDILNFDFPQGNYHYIIHAATEADAALNQGQPLLMVDTIINGTRRVLDFAKLQPIESFLFTSSGAVYGRQPSHITHAKETDSFPVDINNPNSAYAEGKRLAELYCSIYFSNYKVPVKIARCFAFAGPYLPLDKHFAIGNFILNAIRKEDIIIKGDGTPFRSYLYAADLTVWLWTILLKGENNTPYNVGSDEGFDLKTVANMVAELSPGINVQVLTKTDPCKPLERYIPDVSFIKESLGVQVSFDLKETIVKTKTFMQGYKPFRTCCICGSNYATSLYDIRFKLFDGHPMKDGYEVVECEQCNFVYADTHVTQNDLDIYYKELSKYEDKTIGTGGGYTPEDKDRLHKAAISIKENVDDKSIRILDLGCANGGLLKELKELGFTNLVGVDPSLNCVNTTIHEVGCEAFQSSAFDLRDDKLGKFDLIILSHVLEHILDITSIINHLKSLLNKNGMVYVECPNAENYYKVIHAPVQEFNTEHINHFTKVSFQNLFGLNGFDKIVTGNRVIKIASQQDYNVVYGIFRKKEDFSYQIKKDEKIHERILDYIKESELLLKAIEEEISKLISYKPIALYGIGQFAFKLLASPVLNNGRLKLFDNNTSNVGKTINGAHILAGNTIKNEFLKEEFTLVITSLIHEEGIRKQIQSSFQDQNNRPAIIGFKKYLKD